MTKAEQIRSTIDVVQEMTAWVVQFDSAYRDLARLRQYSSTDFMMMHYDQAQTQAKGNDISERLLTARQNVSRRIREVTSLLDKKGIASIWTIYPPPAIGGLVRRLNIFEAFIDLDLEPDERPSFMQISDTLDKAKWACEDLLRVELETPSSPIANRLKVVPKHVGAGLAWLFPSQLQRVILGWSLIALMIGLLLRYVFGIHLEQIGQLIIKWAFK